MPILFIQVSTTRKAPGYQENHLTTTCIFSLRAQKKTEIGSNTSYTKTEFSLNWVFLISIKSWLYKPDLDPALIKQTYSRYFAKYKRFTFPIIWITFSTWARSEGSDLGSVCRVPSWDSSSCPVNRREAEARPSSILHSPDGKRSRSSGSGTRSFRTLQTAPLPSPPWAGGCMGSTQPLKMYQKHQ